MEEYLLELQVALKSAGYIRSASASLKHMAIFMKARNINHPSEITRTDLLEFQSQAVNSRGDWSESYKAQTMRNLRTYFGWALDVGHIDAMPFVRIRVTPPPKQPKPLADDEVERLLDAHRQTAFRTTPFVFHRREMILAALLTWGLRVHELEAMTIDDFDPSNDYLTAINKGGGTKTLPYPEELKRIYLRWARVRATKALSEERSLLITTKGEPMPKDQISRTISDLAVAAGMDVNAHQLRDTCGTQLLSADVPVERVAKILGHKSIKTTLTYAEVRDEKVAESHARAMNPKLRELFRQTGEPLFRNTSELIEDEGAAS
jgi:integrase/recombinase XerD